MPKLHIEIGANANPKDDWLSIKKKRNKSKSTRQISKRKINNPPPFYFFEFNYTRTTHTYILTIRLHTKKLQ